MKLNNKVAVITGAGSGIGRAIAFRFAAEGARIVVAEINKESGEETGAAELATAVFGIQFQEYGIRSGQKRDHHAPRPDPFLDFERLDVHQYARDLPSRIPGLEISGRPCCFSSRLP